jgi:acyl-CoA thioesterase
MKNYREEPYLDMAEMISKDDLAMAFGISLLEAGEGKCKMSMKVKEGMLNAYGAVHGAVLFALADCAFAVASNSYGVKGVALSANVQYRRPAGLGDELFAEAVEESRGKTTALYRIRIKSAAGKMVALVDGLAFLSHPPEGQMT